MKFATKCGFLAVMLAGVGMQVSGVLTLGLFTLAWVGVVPATLQHPFLDLVLECFGLMAVGHVLATWAKKRVEAAEAAFQDRWQRLVDEGGRGFAHYHEPMTNRQFPHLEDGLQVSVVAYQSESYLVDGYSVRPDWGRDQFNVSKQFPTYAEAKKAAKAYLVKARRFVTKEEKYYFAYAVGGDGNAVLVHCREVDRACDERNRMKFSDAKTVGFFRKKLTLTEARKAMEERGWMVTVVR